MQFQDHFRSDDSLAALMGRAPQADAAERALQLATPLIQGVEAAAPALPDQRLFAWTSASAALLDRLFPGTARGDLVVLPDDGHLPAVQAAIAGQGRAFFRLLMRRFGPVRRAAIRPELVERLRFQVTAGLLAGGLELEDVSDPAALAKITRHMLAFCLLYAGLADDQSALARLERFARLARYAIPILLHDRPARLWIAYRG